MVGPKAGLVRGVVGIEYYRKTQMRTRERGSKIPKKIEDVHYGLSAVPEIFFGGGSCTPVRRRM